MKLEEADELFGGKNTKITEHGAHKALTPAKAAPGPKAEMPTKAKAKPMMPIKPPSAHIPATLFGCCKCRKSQSGCLKCNPAKFAKWIAKKAAAEAAETPKEAQKEPAKEEGGISGKWPAVEEAELVMPKDHPGPEDELPDDFELAEGELDSEAKALLDIAFAPCAD